MAASLRNSVAFAALLVCVVGGGVSALLGQGRPSPSSPQQDSPILEGIVLEGDLAVDAATVILHRVRPNTSGLEPGPVSGEVGSATVGPGGEFQFLLPSAPDADIEGDVYFASVEYEGVLYFGSGITALEQLDSLYVVRVFKSEEVPLEGVPLLVEQRAVFIEFAGEEWFATDLFVILNQGTRTLLAQENGIVWSYPLPPGAAEPILGDGGDLPPDAVTFEGGRVRVSAPLPPGGSGFMIRYRLEKLGSTIPAPGRTALFEVMIREPSPPLRVDGLEPLDVVALEPGSTFRRYGATELVDVNLTLVEIEEQGPPPLEWLALLTTLMLAAGGFLAYARPRKRVAVGEGLGLGREALILEVARIDDVLAETVEPDEQTEILKRRAALLSLLRTSD